MTLKVGYKTKAAILDLANGYYHEVHNITYLSLALLSHVIT